MGVPDVNVLLYGKPKTGKTVGAASTPGPILYINADRPNALRMARSHYPTKQIDEVKVHDLQTLIDVINELTENKVGYKSVVVDTVAELHRKVLEGLSGRAIRPQINHYGDVSVHLERFERALCDLPVNAVFVLHETSQKDEDTGGYERTPFTGTNNPAPAAKLSAMVDIIGYTGVVAGEGDEGPRYLAQLVATGSRQGGSRFASLGPLRDVNITEWVRLAHQELSENSGKKESSA